MAFVEDDCGELLGGNCSSTKPAQEIEPVVSEKATPKPAPLSPANSKPPKETAVEAKVSAPAAQPEPSKPSRVEERPVTDIASEKPRPDPIKTSPQPSSATIDDPPLKSAETSPETKLAQVSQSAPERELKAQTVPPMASPQKLEVRHIKKPVPVSVTTPDIRKSGAQQPAAKPKFMEMDKREALIQAQPAQTQPTKPLVTAARRAPQIAGVYPGAQTAGAYAVIGDHPPMMLTGTNPLAGSGLPPLARPTAPVIEVQQMAGQIIIEVDPRGLRQPAADIGEKFRRVEEQAEHNCRGFDGTDIRTVSVTSSCIGREVDRIIAHSADPALMAYFHRLIVSN